MKRIGIHVTQTHHGVSIADPLFIVLTHLSCSYYVGLCLDSTRAQKRLYITWINPLFSLSVQIHLPQCAIPVLTVKALGNVKISAPRRRCAIESSANRKS